MKTVELFCGTKSFSKYAESLGHETFTVDIDPDFKPDLVLDLLEPFNQDLKNRLSEADIIWMSPPCTTLSMASGNKHFNKDHTFKTEQGRKAIAMIEQCRAIAGYCLIYNKIYFIENPRARARWFLPSNFTRKTITLCQYGDTRMKPTDIWTNCINWIPRTMCRNGDKCHEAAPRGSKTGTQGLKNAYERGKLPIKLCEEIVAACS